MKQQLKGVWAVLFALSVLSLIAFSLTSGIAYAARTTGQEYRPATTTVTVWLQTMDSCRQAIPGAYFTLRGNGLYIVEGPGPGTGPKTVGSGNCPLQRGDCVTVPTGCLSWTLPVPSTGSMTYKIKETTHPKGYVPCDGGSVCPGGPEVVTLTIDAAGGVSATTLNIYPDGTSVVYPTSGAPYTATQSDPIVTHNFQLGNGSCDGDHDKDDRLTGSPGSHCDSDSD